MDYETFLLLAFDASIPRTEATIEKAILAVAERKSIVKGAPTFEALKRARDTLTKLGLGTFVDFDKETGLLDPESLDQFVENRKKLDIAIEEATSLARKQLEKKGD